MTSLFQFSKCSLVLAQTAILAAPAGERLTEPVVARTLTFVPLCSVYMKCVREPSFMTGVADGRTVVSADCLFVLSVI